MDTIEKVYKLVEVDLSEVESLSNMKRFLNCKKDKAYYNKPKKSRFQNRNHYNGRYRQGNGKYYQKKRFQKFVYVEKMSVVHETSSEKEKESHFSRQTNEELFAKKKQQQAKDVSNKMCFKCNQVGHIGRKCPQNSKPVYVKKKEKSEDLNLKTPMFAPKQVWKQTNESSKGNIHNDSKFYVKNVSKGQTWVIRKKVTFDAEKKHDSAD
ncbi:putative transcription factor interactor and regulator CCHC(Zn) family [Helianthus anomalus]